MFLFDIAVANRDNVTFHWNEEKIFSLQAISYQDIESRVFLNSIIISKIFCFL